MQAEAEAVQLMDMVQVTTQEVQVVQVEEAQEQRQLELIVVAE
jgi:hypothetical protein